MNQLTYNKPLMLLATDCIPDPSGMDHQKRAWQWLEIGSQTHMVYLIAVARTRVNLKHWEQLSSIAHNVALVPQDAAIRHCLRPGDSLHSHISSQSIDVTVTNSAHLLQKLADFHCRLRICDMAQPLGNLLRNRAQASIFPLKWWLYSRAKAADQRESQISWLADLILLHDESNISPFRQTAVRTVVMPRLDHGMIQDMLESDHRKHQSTGTLQAPAAYRPAA